LMIQPLARRIALGSGHSRLALPDPHGGTRGAGPARPRSKGASPTPVCGGLLLWKPTASIATAIEGLANCAVVPDFGDRLVFHRPSAIVAPASQRTSIHLGPNGWPLVARYRVERLMVAFFARAAPPRSFGGRCGCDCFKFFELLVSATGS